MLFGAARQGGLTRADGRFLILNVPAGSYELRAERIGLGASTQSVTVTAGATATVNFALESQALGFLIFFITALIAIPAITYADRVWRKKKHRQLEDVGAMVAGVIAAHQEGEPVDAIGLSVGGVLDIPAGETEAAPVRRRERTR